MRQILLKRLTETHNDTPETGRPPVRRRRRRHRRRRGRRAVHPRRIRARQGPRREDLRRARRLRRQPGHLQHHRARPSGHSYGKAISKALADANLPPTAVDLLVPCGLGIPSHDRAELNGLHNVFGGGLERVPLVADQSPDRQPRRRQRRRRRGGGAGVAPRQDPRRR